MIDAEVIAPFPGLRPFKSSESHLFFGRDEHVEALLTRLAERRLLAVVGASGSGKSSLIHAGLIPALERGYLGPPGSRWVIAVLLRPGIGPFEGMARAVAEAFQYPAANVPDVLSVLTNSSRGLSDFARRCLRPGEQLMVVVDQFEELFRYRQQAGDKGRIESTAFVKLLLAATGNSDVAPGSADPPVYVVLSMRSDYLGKCAQFRGLPETLNDAQYLVPRISRDQQREAIEGPIALAGAQITERLVARILDDAGDDPDQLPVLQHALLRVWEQSAESRASNAALDLPHYESSAVGGIAEALDRDAENAFGKLVAGQPAIARRMFQRLVDPGAGDEETRRPVPLSEISRICQVPESEVLAVIEVFRERGFLTLSSELPAEKDPLIDISHESLIRQWKRLKEWVEKEAASAAIYRRLAESALNRRSLYSGPDLAQALQWERDESPNREWACRYNKNPEAWNRAVRFLRHSEKRQKLARATYVLLVVGAIALAAVFFVLYRNAEHQKQLATAAQNNAEEQKQLVTTALNNAGLHKRLADSNRLAATASVIAESRPDLALLLSIEARNAGAVEARNALLALVQLNPRLVAYLHHPAVVYGVALSPDGKTLASASEDSIVRLWDMATRRELEEPMKGHTDGVFSVAFSPDGKTLASASADHTIRLWDVATRRARGEPMKGHTDSVFSVAFSPDGKTLASASADHTVRLWDVATRRALAGEPLKGHTDMVFSVAFTPDGKLLASASADKTVCVWDVATRQLRGDPLKGHTGAVNSVVFSPDGETLASAGDDQTVRLWDVATRQLRGDPLKGHKDAVNRVAFSPDGKILVSASTDRTLRLWDMETLEPLGEPLKGHTGPVSSVVFGPDGETLASAGLDDTVRLWQLAIPQPMGKPLKGHTSSAIGVAFSPDGKTLASGGGDHTVRLWDVATRRALGNPLKGHTDTVWGVVFSPDGKTVASAGADRTIRLWDVATRALVGEPLKGHTAAIISVQFSPDGTTLVSAGVDRTIRFWDVATRRALGEPLKGHTAAVNVVVFSPDGKTLASAGDDQTVRLWDVASRQPLGEPLKGHKHYVFGLAFSPDGKTLASAGWDPGIRLWDVASRQALGELLKGDMIGLRGVAFSPDGKVLASASDDWTVRLWDLTTRQALGESLIGHTDIVFNVAFSPDGRTLASASRDHTVWLWDVDPDSWVSRACEQANRNLSLTEWKLFIGENIPYHRTCPSLLPGEGAPAK